MFKNLYVKVKKMEQKYHHDKANKYWDRFCDEGSNWDDHSIMEERARYHTRREDEIANEILELEGI